MMRRVVSGRPRVDHRVRKLMKVRVSMGTRIRVRVRDVAGIRVRVRVRVYAGALLGDRGGFHDDG